MESFEKHEPSIEQASEKPPVVLLESNIREALKVANTSPCSLAEQKDVVHAECKNFLRLNGYPIPENIEDFARSFYFCINLTKQALEDEIQEDVYAPENLALSRDQKKAIIRRKCVDLCSNIYRFNRDTAQFFAMPLFKYLEDDPNLFDKLWEVLYKISENAENTDQVLQFYEELNALHPTGTNFLWVLTHSIVRGDYEVLRGTINDDPFYFLHIPGNTKERNKNKNRISSSIAIKESMKGKLITTPIPGLRVQDFMDFDEREEEIFRTIFGTFKQDIDTLLFSSTPHDVLVAHVNWALDLVKKEIDSLEVSDFDKQKYHLFMDTLIMSEYFGQLLDYAQKMSEENNNDFAKDILNEPFLIRNRLISENGAPHAILDYLKARWRTLIIDLRTKPKTAPKKIRPDSKPENLSQTMAFDAATFRERQLPAFAKTEPVQALQAVADTDMEDLVRREEKKVQSIRRKVKSGTLLFIQTTEESNDGAENGFLHPSFTDQEVPTILRRPDGEFDFESLIKQERDKFGIQDEDHVQEPVRCKSDYEIGFIAPGCLLEKQKLREIQQLVNEAFANRLRLYDPMEVERLKQVIESVKPLCANTNLRKELMTAIIYELKLLQGQSIDEGSSVEYNELYSYLRSLFTELLASENHGLETKIPTDEEIVALNETLPELDPCGVPELSDHSELKEYLESKGLLGEALKNEKDLRDLLILGIKEFQMIIKLYQRVLHATDPISVIPGFKKEIQAKLDSIRKFRKKAQGGFVRKIVRNKKLNSSMNKYFDALEEYIDTLWDQAIESTINNFQSAYFV